MLTSAPESAHLFEPRPQPGKRPLVADFKKFPLPEGIRRPPYEVIVSDDAARNKTKSISTIKMQDIPPGTFIRLDDHYALCTPEACFLLKAKELGLIRLIQLGYMLCGTYAITPHNITPNSRTRYGVSPLTTVARIAAYLDGAADVDGVKKARKALQFVLDNSASPRETDCAMVLTLPPRMGGYGLPKPVLNARVEIPQSRKDLFKSGYYICDLLWDFDGRKVALEYDSDQFHTPEERIANDTVRRNALSTTGVIVLGFTNKQAHSRDGWNTIAVQLRELRGKRCRAEGPKVLEQRRLLLDELRLCRIHEDPADDCRFDGWSEAQ